MTERVKRKSCRAILLTPCNEILLIKIHNPYTHWSGWITPGGGINNGEDEKTALSRELTEELGLISIVIGGIVWIRHHTFLWQDKVIEQSEDFFLVQHDKFNPIPDRNVEDIDNLKIFKWWTVDELKYSIDNFVPQNICILLESLIKNGVPDKPIKIGI